MAKTTPPPGNTGGALAGAAAAATNLAGPALDLAQGATAVQAASNVLKDSVLTKLLGPTALFAGSLIGVLRTVKAIVDQSGLLERGLKNIASIQQIEGKFEVLLKSADKAQERLKDLYKFTASAPFDFSDVAEANRVLETLTGGALSGTEAMRTIGDTAASTGQSMSEVAGRVGKLYAALRSGRGLDRVLFQLQSSGAVSDELAAKLETLTQSGAGFNEMWAAVAASLARSDGAMKKDMGNLDALAKRLKTAGEMMDTAFSKNFVEAQSKAIETSLKATQNLTPILAKVGADLAPVLQLFSSAKNSIAEVTIATDGFAQMVGVAWEGAKALFVGLAGSAVATFAARISSTTTSVIQFGVQLKAAADIAKAAPSSIAGFAQATSLAADASAAFARNEFLSAAALKLKSYWAVVATTATNVHATSMIRAATATSGVSVATYIWATATQVAAGSIKLLAAGLRMASAAFATFIVANPILAIGAAVMAAVYAMKQWSDSVDATAAAYDKVVRAMGKVRAEMRAQVDAVRNLDQWKKALADNEVAIKNNGDAQKALGERPDPGQQFDYVTGKMVAKPDGKAQKDYDALNAKHNLTTRALVDERARIMSRDMDTVGLGGDEQAKLGDRVAGNKRLAEARRQASVANADDGGRLQFLESEIIRLTRDADVGEAIDRKRISKERNPEATELTRLQARIDEIEDTKELGGLSRVNQRIEEITSVKAEDLPNPVSPEGVKRADELAGLQKERAVLQSSLAGKKQAAPGELNDLYLQRTELGAKADSHVENREKAIAAKAEYDILKSTIALKLLTLDLEFQIAEVRAKGGETAAMEANKELVILKKQLEIAKLKGANGKIEAAEKAVAIAKIEGERGKARAEIALDRAKNNAQINRDPRAAQALTDAADREKLRADYRAKGLTNADADSDFAANIKSQAAQTAPRIVADSLQSIGGGGGSSGSDPMLAAQARIEKLNATQAEYLRIIADAARGDGSKLRD